MPLEAIIFDVDGTLAETEEIHRRAFNDAFAALGLNWIWSPELYRELLQITGGKERIRYYIDAWRPEGAEVALARFAELHAEKTRRYGELVSKGEIKPRPGVLRLMQEMRKAVPAVKLAIATTTDPANVEALLKASFAADASSWFSVIGAGDVVGEKKPSPEIYDYVLERLGCAPGHAIAIEDSDNGIAAAQGAGLTVIATPSRYTDTDDLSAADLVLSSLGEADAPSRFLSGRKLGLDYVTLPALRAWLGG
jgi:HAD superfamily hydrolase (TIGR01509 family)